MQDKFKDKNTLRAFQIVQKAKELGDGDLINEELVRSLMNHQVSELKGEEKAKIAELLNTLIDVKEKATLSK